MTTYKGNIHNMMIGKMTKEKNISFILMTSQNDVNKMTMDKDNYKQNDC